jgi:hypothetical protein
MPGCVLDPVTSKKGCRAASWSVGDGEKLEEFTIGYSNSMHR